ncbi:hypothetical protein [Paludisphaera soli]|uniref:hypothetical protein n=1 Tax=Paludisphaera soli TaxID=2712865 RepID=UPI0013EC0840|nr:hypothetical protein [Paludisphaera soli]
MRLLGLLGILVATASAAQAGTHVTTFGGGPPSHNQISLERNVAYFRRVLAGLGLGGVRHDIYFGDGGAGNTVQRRLPEGDDQRLAKALGLILFNDADADMRYSRVDIPDLVGPSSAANLDAWFEQVGRALPPGERLLFYFTGHGGPDPKGGDKPRNTNLVMPGEPNAYPMERFVGQLDAMSPDVEVTLVMVQCYSGGFANVIYNEGDPARGFARHPRAGFFSTIASRTAAGCTPDIAEEDYHEFSTSFFEALAGETRTGRAVTRPDFDGDGRTSYAEAFAHVLLSSDTIDLPTTTSDRLLRDKSRFARAEDGPAQGLLPQDAPWSTVIAAASPPERAALEGLSQLLGLDGEDRLTRARAKAKAIDPSRNTGRGRGRNQPRDRPEAAQAEPEPESFDREPTAQAPTEGGRRGGPGPAAGRLRSALADRWPELTVPLHPDAPRILAEQGGEIRRFLEAQPDYRAFAGRLARRPAPGPDDPERRWVKYQRLLDRADSVILGANLARINDPEALGVFRRLVELEARTLGPDRPPIAEGRPAAPTPPPAGS